jgi:hypothetical protein
MNMNKLSKKSNNSSQIAGAEAFIAGFKKHLMTVSSMNVAGKAFTPTQVVAALQARIDAVVAAQTARGALKAAVSSLKSEKANTNDFVIALHAMVKAMFSTQPDVLADFGLQPRKRTAPSVTKKAVAVQKNKATRKARGTVGPKKKLSIHGVLPGNETTNSDTSTSTSSTTTTVPKP